MHHDKHSGAMSSYFQSKLLDMIREVMQAPDHFALVNVVSAMCDARN